jgi:hypothetical protein
VTLPGGKDAVGLNVLDLVRPRSERYAAQVLDRANTGTLRGRPITVVTPEDLVILKLLASRERDLEDAASVLGRTGDVLDTTLIDREADALALGIPDWRVQERWAAAQRQASR